MAQLAQLSYTGALNGNGYSSFTFQVRDNGGTANAGVDLDQSPNTITFNVTAVNDAPLASPDNAAVVESGVNPGNTAFAGTPVASGNVLSNDTDPDALDTKTVSAVNGQSASVGVVIIGLYGSVQINADGSYTYTLDNSKAATQALTQGQLASEAFSYTVKDTAGATSSSTLTVSVTGTNDAPVATADTASTPLNVALASINVKGNDTDVDSTPASLVVSNPVLSNPAQGSVSVNADGTLNFTPASGVSGPVVISYTLTDDKGASTTGTLTVTIGPNTAAPAAPVAVLNPFAPDDTGTIGDSTTSNPSPAISGSGSPGEIITLYAADGVSVLGTAVVNASGTWSIDPLVNYLTEGLNSLSVKATDSAGNQGPATLVAVTLDTTAPAAPTVVITEDTNNDGFISAAELSGLIDVSIGLPADAKAGDSLTVTDGTSTNTIVLTATQISAGSVTSSFASPGEGNTISVTAKITDAAGNPGTTSLADSAKVDTTPTSANPDAVVASEQTPLVIDVATLLNNDHGALGQPLFIASVQGAVNGSVVITDGKVVFTPNVGFIGAANFTYTVKDGNGGSSTASVSVTVLADAPSFTAEAVVYKPSVSMPRPVFSNDPALHVLYSINDIRIDTGLRSGLGIFQTDSVTMAELLSEQAFALDNLTAPRGLDGVDDSHLRGNGIGSQNALFVQHAVRHEALVSEVGLFVQNAVRASQLESLARNIKVDTFNSAVPGVGTLLDAFALGSPVVSPVTALAEALERERQNRPTSRLEKEDSLQASSRVKVEQPYSTPVAADDVSTFQVKRRAADGFATQLRRNATAFRTSALRPETPLSATTRVTR